MTAFVVVAALLASATVAHADSLDAVVRAKLALPAGLGIVTVHDTSEVSPETVALEAPASIKVGRQSIKLYIRGKQKFVQVTFGKLVLVPVARRAIADHATLAAADFELVLRAGATPAGADLVGATAIHAIVQGATISANDVVLPAPLARGTQVRVEVRRGAIRVKTTGTLELAARAGQPASVRLATSSAIVRGTLLATNVVVVGESP